MQMWNNETSSEPSRLFYWKVNVNHLSVITGGLVARTLSNQLALLATS